MKKYLVNFVLSYEDESYNEDTFGLDVFAENIEELWELLESDSPYTIDSKLTISERIEEMVEKHLGGLKYDTFAPVQIGEHLEDGSVEVRWTDESFRFENESTH
jgi:hypothetical protein